MVAANDLIMIFIGLEISSIATYILAGYLRNDKRNNEAALKYFLLGSFATAFLLYGIALIYGVTGTTKLDDIRTALNNPAASSSFMMVGVAAALMFVGLAFKVSGAPFQIWAPDVYQGAPAPVSAFLATSPESRRIRHLPAHLRDRIPADLLRLGTAHLDLGASLDDDWELCRPYADQSEENAGLQLHRPCRIYSGRAGRPFRNRAPQRRCSISAHMR